MSGSPKKPFNRKANIDFTFDDEPKKQEPSPADNDEPEIVFTPDDDFGDDDDGSYSFTLIGGNVDIPQDVLYDLASKSMPKTPEVQKVLDYASNLDYMCLLTAISVQEELAGKISAVKLDRLTAAALVLGAENVDDIYDLFNRETMSIVDEFLSMLMQDDGDERVVDIAEFSADTKRIFLCNIITDLQVVAAGLKAGTGEAHPMADLQALGDIVEHLSHTGDADRHLLSRVAEFFNENTTLAHYPLRLNLNADGTVEIEKFDPPAQRKGQKPPKP